MTMNKPTLISKDLPDCDVIYSPKYSTEIAQEMQEATEHKN